MGRAFADPAMTAGLPPARPSSAAGACCSVFLRVGLPARPDEVDQPADGDSNYNRQQRHPYAAQVPVPRLFVRYSEKLEAARALNTPAGELILHEQPF